MQTSGRMRLTTCTFILVTLASACGTDGGVEGREAKIATPDGERCAGELAAVGRACPAMFDPARPPACPSAGQPWAGVCEGVDVYRLDFGGGLSGFECAYDPDTHQLIGALNFNDYATYCEDQFPDIVAGRYPAGPCWDKLTPICPK